MKPWCRGCSAVAAGTSGGNFYAPDPQCWKEKNNITGENLEKILEAGNFAPNAGGGQRSMMVAVNNAQLTTKIGIINLEKFDRSNLAGKIVD